MPTLDRFTRGMAALAVAVAFALAPASARAVVGPGDAAPDFTKPEHLTAVQRSLSEWAGKVILLFQFGYNCPVCVSDGPSIEQDIWRHYQSLYPGQVQVLGVDMYNGTDSQVSSFKSSTGATYPLLRLGGISQGGNLNLSYGPWDNHVVINKQGIVRYNSHLVSPHGSRYNVNTFRSVIDSLVSVPASVDPPGPASALRLAIAPNPVADAARVRLVLPGPGVEHTQVTVHDLSGRLVATLWDAGAGPGALELTWGRDGDRGRVAPGVYLVRARAGRGETVRRVVVVP